jgi:uncharacterized membrane-anchored protein
MSGVVLLALGAAVVLPLAREYAMFRRAWGLSRGGALATTLLVLPAVAVATGLALPLAPWPNVQWAAIVVGGVTVYSVAVSRVQAAIATAGPARTH